MTSNTIVSYWEMFDNELEKHINKEDTVFWKKGFEILQNIQDRSTLEKHVKHARDPISITTKNKNQTKPIANKPNLP
jgi:hypothetical protein